MFGIFTTLVVVLGVGLTHGVVPSNQVKGEGGQITTQNPMGPQNSSGNSSPIPNGPTESPSVGAYMYYPMSEMEKYNEAVDVIASINQKLVEMSNLVPRNPSTTPRYPTTTSKVYPTKTNIRQDLPINVEICQTNEQEQQGVMTPCLELDYVLKRVEVAIIHTYEDSRFLISSLVGDLIRLNMLMGEFVHMSQESLYAKIDSTKFGKKVEQIQQVSQVTISALDDQIMLMMSPPAGSMLFTVFFWSLMVLMVISLLTLCMYCCYSGDKKESPTKAQISSVTVVETRPKVCLNSSSEEDILYDKKQFTTYDTCKNGASVNYGYQRTNVQYK